MGGNYQYVTFAVAGPRLAGISMRWKLGVAAKLKLVPRHPKQYKSHRNSRPAYIGRRRTSALNGGTRKDCLSPSIASAEYSSTCRGHDRAGRWLKWRQSG